MNQPAKVMLTASDWAEAALDAIGQRGGIEAVAVEPLARDLGVTKGSFYWHFANREALLVAALQRWEARETDEVLARVSLETDPHERIQRLITEVNASKRASHIYMALSRATQPGFVRAYVHRVAQRRFDFIVDCYAALGLPGQRAREWAMMTFSVFLGALSLRNDLPDEWPAADEPAFANYVRFLMVRLLPQQPHAPGADDRPVPGPSSARRSTRPKESL